MNIINIILDSVIVITFFVATISFCIAKWIEYYDAKKTVQKQKELSRGIHTEGHPATYPVALPAFIIKTYSLIGEIVCDSFLGSGSSMIACEQLDRVCVGIDESKNYCALILERMHREFPNLEIKRI